MNNPLKMTPEENLEYSITQTVFAWCESNNKHYFSAAEVIGNVLANIGIDGCEDGCEKESIDLIMSLVECRVRAALLDVIDYNPAEPPR